MRFARKISAAFGAAALATLASAPSASAALPPAPQPDQVVVFQMEFTPVTVYKSPSGCYSLPIASHVLVNQTDRVVTIYFDPKCTFPIWPVQELKPGNGTHVSPVGSFSV
ncbi:hypothetical protein [Actinokineospora globicatena]|uniref:DUF1573 domain-containing protein n=1 Tax=Actinokineospora globicatena TaxID=103729 RepID=A0A9W6QVD3_9PSEU|nr:hypothetical protein [Actinokineospora globicatena]MCP2302264.1 hypothetical protein [Actinokineospora globicatena]GLW76070.1 hypothetical protein Aglo01_05520 [Actinokineospora globicatena]GLW82905.1 hypothetical protein Aglo02_05450 [Actinokineospora globicatena]GLW95803.1 hypothetical protein Aglo03_66190 [Actinokineospora globicatena]